ncbi:MAG: DUF3880 domain-containing protein [Lachnospiraceae bacterium]|nr:DUF3880 domain-containing protein [Lachnospiraceae bacterium]
MKSYNILYYTWSESTALDTISTLKEMGHNVLISSDHREKYDNDDFFISSIKAKVESHKVDFIFSYNYFPDLSRVASEENILYIAWCYDSPLLTLKSITLGNDCNRVFLFDYDSYDKYIKEGFKTVFYMPLGCNTSRLNSLINKKYDGRKTYKHEVCFLGNLYNDQYDFYSQIKHLPDYLKGYLDSAMEAQMQLFGMDIISSLMNQNICEELAKYVDAKLGTLYRESTREVLINIIHKQTTVRERIRLLTVLGEFFNVSLYSSKKPDNIPVKYQGYAEYMNQMPEVFHSSKINLNITYRGITSGIPLRVIDILGSSAFCLTNYQSELPMYFQNNENIVWYESQEDLFEKIIFYLKNDSERERIANNGHELAKKLFSYDILFNKIFEEAGV